MTKTKWNLFVKVGNEKNYLDQLWQLAVSKNRKIRIIVEINLYDYFVTQLKERGCPKAISDIFLEHEFRQPSFCMGHFGCKFKAICTYKSLVHKIEEISMISEFLVDSYCKAILRRTKPIDYKNQIVPIFNMYKNHSCIDYNDIDYNNIDYNNTDEKSTRFKLL